MTSPQLVWNAFTGNFDYSGSNGGGPGDLHVARFIVGNTSDGANYATIASAYAAAVLAGGAQTIAIQPGTYTENITLQPNINLVAFQADALTPSVIINGKLTATFAGSVSLSGLNLQTNSDFCLAVTGAAATVVNLKGCFINALNHTAINFTSTGAGNSIYLYDCAGNIATTGITLFTHSSISALTFVGGYFSNTGSSSTASTGSNASGGEISFYNSYTDFPITITNGCALSAISCQFNKEITINATLSNNLIFNSFIGAGSASAISIGTGATLKIYESVIDSTNTNAITGLGTLVYGGISFSNTSTTINTTTQVPEAFPVAQGGTGDSTFTSYMPVCGGTSTTGALQSVATGSAGQVLTYVSSSALPTFQAPAASAQSSLGFYGDGSDGAQTFDGTTTILGIVPSGTPGNYVYVLARDIYLTSSTIQSGVSIVTTGFRIFCQGTLTNNGTISYNGNAGTNTGSAGAGFFNSNSSINASASSGQTISTGGGAGNTGAGAHGTNGTTSIGYGGLGSTGGAGGSGGGAGATQTAPTAKISGIRSLPYALTGMVTLTTSFDYIQGGTGGGGGGGDGITTGGGGGGGGGIIIISAYLIAGTGAIQAIGGAGGNGAVAGTNNGGGGGGGGGLIIIISRSVISAAVTGQTISVAGGAGGTATGIGSSNGTMGNSGLTVLLPN